MSGNPVQKRGVLVLDFALDDRVRGNSVSFSVGGIARGEIAKRSESRGRQLEWMENLPPGPGGEVLAHEDFESLAQQDEAGVGVFGPFAWGRLKLAVRGKRETDLPRSARCGRIRHSRAGLTSAPAGGVR